MIGRQFRCVVALDKGDTFIIYMKIVHSGGVAVEFIAKSTSLMAVRPLRIRIQ